MIHNRIEFGQKIILININFFCFRCCEVILAFNFLRQATKEVKFSLKTPAIDKTSGRRASSFDREKTEFVGCQTERVDIVGV